TANRLNLNNGGSGYGVSQPVTILIQDVNPLITEAEKREKEKTAGTLSPVATLTADTTVLPTTTIYQIPVNPRQSVPVTSQGTAVVTISSEITQVQQSVIPQSTVILTVSSSPLPTHSSPSPYATSSIPFPGVLAVIALMYAVIRR
ncbi:MAG: hypothetical protein CVV33_08130, partial [Methanomicrobiales archaeon HGW-Methanomicrobiales-4]